MGEQLNVTGIKTGLSRLPLEKWFWKKQFRGRSFNLILAIQKLFGHQYGISEPFGITRREPAYWLLALAAFA